MSVSIDQLFSRYRFSLEGLNILFFILYIPIGIILAILRLFISLQICLASKVLPRGTAIRKFILRVLYCVVGVYISEENIDGKEDMCAMLISNHISPFDHMVISLIYPCITVNSCNLPEPLSLMLSFRIFGASQSRASIMPKIESYLNKPESLPLLIFPEKATTNGDVALMNYGSWALDVGKPITALGLKSWRLPFVRLSLSPLRSSWMVDLMFLLFSPITVFRVRRIGRFTKGSEESADNFALRIQKATADGLRIQSTDFTFIDKMEYIKNIVLEEAVQSNPFYSPEVQAMAAQVREVLPFVPLDIIRRDIVRTRNVDVTITNILEGNISEPIPDAPPTPSLSPPTSSSPPTLSSSTTNQSRLNSASNTASSISCSGMNICDSSFGKTSSERAESLEKRRAILVQKARQRYFEKIGQSAPEDDRKETC